MPTSGRALPLAALFGLASATPAVQAFNLQLKPSVHLAVQRDDNVFRAPDAPPPGGAGRVADTLTTLGAGARLTLSQSLQTIELRGEVDRVSYARLDALDYNRYLLNAQARLRMASLLKLKLDASRERRQENFAFRDDTESGFITEDRGLAELRLAITPRWTGIASAEHLQTEASRDSNRDSDLRENTGELGIEYRRDGYSSFGLGARVSEGSYPRRMVTAGDGREKDYQQGSVLTRIGYTPSGLSELRAQLAYTERGHDDPAVQDFQGFTGQLGYTRRFSGISQLRIEAYRDLFYVEDVNANYVENLGARLGYDYRWSAKLAFAAVAERYDSSYRASPGLDVAGETRKDDVLSLRLGAEYQPFYRFSLLPEYRYERRGSNVATGRYKYSVYGIDLVYRYGER